MTMSRQTAPIFPREQQQAQALGERLRTARLRRRIPVAEMAARVGVTPKTQRRLEKGDTSVGLAMLIRTLSVLGLAKDLDQIAAQDEIGQRLSDSALPERPRRSGDRRIS